MFFLPHSEGVLRPIFFNNIQTKTSRLVIMYLFSLVKVCNSGVVRKSIKMYLYEL